MVLQPHPCACSTANPSAFTGPSLRDVVIRHSAALEALLSQRLRLTQPMLADSFSAQASGPRAAAPGAGAAWLCGVTLWMLRDTPDAGLAHELSLALPTDAAHALILLALSPRSVLDCTVALCLPATRIVHDCMAATAG